jgi:short-subunit dehydrogenase
MIAHLYAARGASVCVVGRRAVKLEEVVEECQVFSRAKGAPPPHAKKVFAMTADFADVEDMVRVRTAVESHWQGVDTVIVSAGVLALRPVLSIAGLDEEKKSTKPRAQATAEGIQRIVDVSAAATRGNYVGPLVAATTFIPLLTNTSQHPAILLVSSLGAVVPAPTRAIYGSTKAASLMLYQSLAIEHPSVKFSFVIPTTVEGDFRASAVDAGEVRKADPNKHGLKQDDVARRCIKAVDVGDKAVFMPSVNKLAPLLFWVWPAVVERKAKKIYNF